MNMLNSLIMEGKILSRSKDGREFTLVTTRENKNSEGDYVKEEFKFFCTCISSRLADYVKRNYRKGRGIRVVGYLYKDKNKVIIKAEHVEFKPYFEE